MAVRRAARRRTRAVAPLRPRALVARVGRARARARRRRAHAAARAAALLGHLLVQPRRVLHGARGRAARGRARHAQPPAHGRRPAAVRGARPRRACACASSSSARAASPRDLLAKLARSRRRGAARRRRSRPRERGELAAMFHGTIFPVLTPLAVGPGRPFPYISNLSLSLGVMLRDPETGQRRLARVKVPEVLPRFLRVGSRGDRFVTLEDLIAAHLDSLFPGMEVEEHAAFRVTRDADFEIEEAADDLLSAVERELRRRRFGEVVRVELASSMSAGMRHQLLAHLHADDAYVVRRRRAARPRRPGRARRPRAPRPALSRVAGRDAPAAARRGRRARRHLRRDPRGRHPRQPPLRRASRRRSSASSRQAVDDPDVLAIKHTIYRTSGDSPMVPALIRAAEQGKQAVVLVELKARFDEARNIGWARALERAGVHVVHGFPALKTHAKCALVVRREHGGIRRYVHIGTGNYHPRTARLYTDAGLFTCRPDIAADVSDLFNYLTGFGRPQRYRKLLVAPTDLRERIVDEVRRVTADAAAGTPGSYRAEDERPGRPARDRVAVRGLAGRRAGRSRRAQHLLPAPRRARPVREHPRRQRARALPRARAAVRVPRRGVALLPRLGRHDAAQPRLARRGARAGRGPRACAPRSTCLLETSLSDTRSSFQLQPDGAWERRRPAEGEPERSAQEELMARALEAARVADEEADREEAAERIVRAAKRRGEDLQVSRRYAVIDVGTNTVRLLVAEQVDGRLVPGAHRQGARAARARPRARRPHQRREPAARERRAAAASRRVARKLGAADLRIIATSAAREAENGQELAARVLADTGPRARDHRRGRGGAARLGRRAQRARRALGGRGRRRRRRRRLDRDRRRLDRATASTSRTPTSSARAG